MRLKGKDYLLEHERIIIGVKAFSALFPAVLLVLSTASVYAGQGTETRLTLEEVPERAYAGDTITFSGRLVRADTGEGIVKATIILKIVSEEQHAPAERKIFQAGATDYEGRFSIGWVAEADEKETYRVRATYMGTADYSGSESEEYAIEVERINLSVEANKKFYTNGDQLVISGSGRPGDTLSVFVTTLGPSTILTTKIVVDDTGKFSTTLLDWDDYYDTAPYLVYVRSISDLVSSQRLLIYFQKQVIVEPKGFGTLLELDPPSSDVTYGSNLLFRGKLETTTGLPIKEATILIKYRNGTEDGILVRGWTHDNGRFFTNWRALQVTSDDSLTVYASFEGGNGFLESASDPYQIKFKPRILTLELNKMRFLPNELLVVHGIAPTREWVNIELLDPNGLSVVKKSLLVGDGGSYEKDLIFLTKPSYVLPEGEYVVRAETLTKDLPVLTASKVLVFEKPRPLSQYKVTGSVQYEDRDGSRIALEGVRVTISSPYGEVQTYTDSSGGYVLHDLDSIAETVRNVFSVRVDLDGKYFRLIDGSSSKAFSKSVGDFKIGGMHDIEVEPIVFSGKIEASAARIFALQNDVVRFYTDFLRLEPEKIEIEIFSRETPKGKYGFEENSEIPKIWIGKGVSSQRHPYTWDVLAHEYTHYMQDLYASVDHYRSMNHGGFSNPTTADSMVEGFANFMAGVISEHYEKEQAGRFFKYDLESNFQVNSQRFLAEELAVAGVFWDLYDDGEKDDDGISLGIEEIWNLMSSEYRFPAYNNDHSPDAAKRHIYYLTDLHYILMQRQYSGNIGPGEVEKVFNSHGIINGLTDPDRPSRI